MFGILLAGVGDHMGTGLRRAVAKIETLFLVRMVCPAQEPNLSWVYICQDHCVYEACNVKLVKWATKLKWLVLFWNVYYHFYYFYLLLLEILEIIILSLRNVRSVPRLCASSQRFSQSWLVAWSSSLCRQSCFRKWKTGRFWSHSTLWSSPSPLLASGTTYLVLTHTTSSLISHC